MALIHCPECEEKISDKATACPRCGYPMNRDYPFLTPLAELADIFSRTVREAFGPEPYSEKRRGKGARSRPERTEDPKKE